jgi:hypothetical protein
LSVQRAGGGTCKRARASAAMRFERGAQRAVGRDAAAHDQLARARLRERGGGLGHELIDGRRLKLAHRSASAAPDGTPCARRCVATAVFMPLKLKSSPRPRIARGKFHGARVAVGRERVDARTGGVTEAEHLADLVERLAGGVVARGAEHAVTAEVLDHDELGVPTRDEQREVRKRGRRVVLEEHRAQVAFEVIDADERQAARPRDRLRRLHADEERADQAGTARDRQPADVVEGGAGRAETLRR